MPRSARAPADNPQFTAAAAPPEPKPARARSRAATNPFVPPADQDLADVPAEFPVPAPDVVPVPAVDRRLEYTPLDELLAAHAPRNPKNHDLDALTTSLRRFGFTAPGVLDERTGRLVAGHGRSLGLAVLRDAGEDPPEGIHRDGDTWLVPLIRGWTSRSDAEAEAYLVADNRHTELGGWDTNLLTELLADMDEDLAAAAGYLPDDIAQLIARANEAIPEGFEFPAFDESAADGGKGGDAKQVTCPDCGAEFAL